MRLWTVNRWLRYTGFRVIVGVPDSVLGCDGQTAVVHHYVPLAETRIIIKWVGLPGSKGWYRWEPKFQARYFESPAWTDPQGYTDEELELLADDIIAYWHHPNCHASGMPLHEFLGLSWTEYTRYEKGERLGNILRERQA